MPNTRESSAPVMSVLTKPTDQLMKMTSIATSSLTASYMLWSELFENQKRFTARLLGAMRGSPNTQDDAAQSSTPPLVRAIVDDGESALEQLNRVVDALPRTSGATNPGRRRTPAKAPRPVSEFPIKRYDSLTVQEITSKIDRLQDRRSIRAVLAYEAKNKGRKGVAAAGEARLERLRDQ